MRAVLKDALDVLFKFDGVSHARGRQLFDEAERWIKSDDTRWPFSFMNVCDALGLAPSCIRKGVTRCLAAQRATRHR